MIKGLTPIKRKDHRTYDFHATFGTATATPTEFNFDTSGLFPDQNVDGLPNACTAYTINDAASNEDKCGYYDDQAFTYNNTKLMAGLQGDVPVDIMTALKSATVYGVKRKDQKPEEALANRRSPYFIVKKDGDYFGGFISAMWVKQGGLIIGTPWLSAFEAITSNGLIPPFFKPASFTSGHCWEAVGVKVINGEQHIICKSWQGTWYGDKGYCYFNRKQINDLLSMQGAGAFVQKHASLEDIVPVKMSVLETLISFLHQLIEKLTSAPKPVAVAPVEPPQPQPEPMQPKYLWDTKDFVRHSIRVICDEYHLTWTEKNVVCAVIQAESGFNTQAKNVNTNGTIDWGLCQINDYWWIGPGKYFASKEEVLTNPEKSVRFMIERFKEGKISLWNAFKNGSYLKYMV